MMSPASDIGLRIEFHCAFTRLDACRVFAGAGTGIPEQCIGIARKGIAVQGLSRLGHALLQAPSRELEVEKRIPVPRLKVLGIQFERTQKLALSFRFVPCA